MSSNYTHIPKNYKSSRKMKFNNLQINFSSFCKIWYQSSHAYIQSFFHLSTIITSKVRFIVEVEVEKIGSCMQRPMKLTMPSSIDYSPNLFITTFNTKLISNISN